jgi:hypothetical protein
MPSPRHPLRRVVFMKPAKLGATTCGSNWIVGRGPWISKTVGTAAILEVRLT